MYTHIHTHANTGVIVHVCEQGVCEMKTREKTKTKENKFVGIFQIIVKHLHLFFIVDYN